MTLDGLSDQDLNAVGLTDPRRAREILRSLAGSGVTDEIVEELLPAVIDALRQSPDPDRALLNFARWTDSVTSRYTHFQYLLRHPSAISIFFNVCGVSQFFSDILIRNPEYFEILANPGVRGGSAAGVKSAAAYCREISGFVNAVVRPELKLESMRRFKQREILRIGTRDILGLADMPSTAREFSNLADACVQTCLDIGIATLAEQYGEASHVPFVVVGMGKLGGQELNYSSDIDLLFVCADSDSSAASGLSPLEYAHKLAEFVINALSRNMQNGHLFRVDMRLRPEGRFGALVRTLSSYKAYYESWAEPWERQAMIKARVVAGDSHLAEGFEEVVTPFVYRRSVTSEFVRAIRENKERIEKKAEIEGVAHTNVKTGFGGIRDVEFAVQMLQLQLGGRDSRVRSRGTLEALARLRQVGAIGDAEAAELAEDYKFLRTVEHRLQILYERQTQSLPTDPVERRLLARRLGFSDAPAFDTDYGYRTRRVRKHFEQIFLADGAAPESRADFWRDLLLTVESDSARSALIAALASIGFIEPERSAGVLHELVAGGHYGASTPEARTRFLEVGGRLIDDCARTGDPDSALDGVAAIAQASPNPAAFFVTLSRGEELLSRLCRLAAASPPIVRAVARHPEWLDLLVSEEIVEPGPKTAATARSELDSRLKRVRSDESRWDALALYIQRERLRIAARDVWGEIDVEHVGQELANLAEAVLGILLDWSKQKAAKERTEGAIATVLNSIAVIGLGKLGGGELGYASDWDVLFVYDARNARGDSPEIRHEEFAAVTAVVENILAAAEKLRPRGAPVEVDARLRPEGRKGALAYPPAAYRAYYTESALTWELQALTRARPVAGSLETGRAYMRAAHEAVYASPLTQESLEEIRAMKRRIENERLDPSAQGEDVKLGHGGLSDIEFLAQMLQMKHGAGHPQVRLPRTAEALRALAGIGALAAPEALRLIETHGFYTGLRNRLALLGVADTDTLPREGRRLRELAIGLGFVDQPGRAAQDLLRREFEGRMRETRAAVRRLFYGER